jgi:hypothetical protein
VNTSAEAAQIALADGVLYHTYSAYARASG